MKQRIVSCKTAFTKDLTRFAPAWGIYFVVMALLLLPPLAGSSSVDNAGSLSLSIGKYAIVNFLYAGLCAQLLFGDLFKQRLCFGLHALPLKRGGWFFSHVCAGLSVSLLPNSLCALLLMPLLEQYWFVALFWLGGMTLEFLFFFGLGTLSMLAAGNRFAMTAIYGLLNFLSVLALWFVKTLAEPLLFGLYVPEQPFYTASPVVRLFMQGEYVRFLPAGGTMVFAGLGDGWLYLLILAGAGVLAGAAALLLYRRRDLESAGDPVAFRWLRPVFCVVYTLAATGLLAAAGQLLFEQLLWFALAGFLLGYFTSQMLLNRTVKVFRGKVFAWFGIFAALLGVALAVLLWDPLGYSSWTPQFSEVTSVRISNSIRQDDYYREELQLQDPQDLQILLELHEQVVEAGQYATAEDATDLQIVYTLSSGRKVSRSYRGCVPAQPLAPLFSSRAQVLGITADVQNYLDSVRGVMVEKNAVTGEAAQTLLQALVADCDAGTMAQQWQFHPHDYVCVNITVQKKDGLLWQVKVFTDAQNSVDWLKKNFDLWAEDGYEPEDYFLGK